MHTHQVVREIAREEFKSQRELAEKAGIQPQHLSRQLNGEDPLSFDYAHRIADVVSTEWKERLAIAFAKDHFKVTMRGVSIADPGDDEKELLEILRGFSPSLRTKMAAYLKRAVEVPGYLEGTIANFDLLR